MMIKKHVDILLPFFATLFLWRLSAQTLNPNGILALVPIFYYSIVRERAEFLPMALIGCFLLDRNFDTMLFWTALFSLFYAVLGLQSYINPAAQRIRGIYLFMAFVGIGLLFLGIWSMFETMSLLPIWTTIWVFAITTVAYIPLTYLFEKTTCWIKK